MNAHFTHCTLVYNKSDEYMNCTFEHVKFVDEDGEELKVKGMRSRNRVAYY